MNLEEAIEILKEHIRVDRIFREHKKEKSDFDEFCEGQCIAIDIILKALDERYNKGYQDGFKQAKFDCEMDKLDGR